MQIDKSSESGVTTLKLTGEIDLHGSPALRAELQKCASEKAPVLLVDFTGVEYIDSSGLATFNHSVALNIGRNKSRITAK